MKSRDEVRVTGGGWHSECRAAFSLKSFVGRAGLEVGRTRCSWGQAVTLQGAGSQGSCSEGGLLLLFFFLFFFSSNKINVLSLCSGCAVLLRGSKM